MKDKNRFSIGDYVKAKYGEVEGSVMNFAFLYHTDSYNYLVADSEGCLHEFRECELENKI